MPVKQADLFEVPQAWDFNSRNSLLLQTQNKFCKTGVAYKTKEIEDRAYQCLVDAGEQHRLCKTFARTIAEGLQVLTLGNPKREKRNNVGAWTNPIYDPDDERFGRRTESCWTRVDGLIIPTQDPERPGNVYIGYDGAGGLRYIGKETEWFERPREHIRGKLWASEIVQWNVRKFPTEKEALDVERVAIQIFDPPENKALKLDGDNPIISAPRSVILKAMELGVHAPFAMRISQ